jgi:hypothetical protein
MKQDHNYVFSVILLKIEGKGTSSAEYVVVRDLFGLTLWHFGR